MSYEYALPRTRHIRPSPHRSLHILRFAFEEWRCLLITALILLCVLSISWCFNLIRFYKHDGTCQPVHYSLAAMMLLLLYLIYLFECFNCRTRLDLSSATDVTQIMPLIEAAVKQDPKLWWLCFAYHYVRQRRRRSAVYNAEPHDRVITSAKQHFINESAALKCVWRDKSPQIEWTRVTAVRVTFVKEFIFADEATRDQYEIHKSNFMKIQEFSDDFMEIKDGKSAYININLQSKSCVFKCFIIIIFLIGKVNFDYV
ncbi:unnamed protein product [Rodentolepis nana]|uniref:Uncharacterized protein n=1 Tax=Rodentolepis nana TaxID=102285 RepID=A0A3P7SVR6_RODNA|nr:unnamed protein product [Rodentolepis nana]